MFKLFRLNNLYHFCCLNSQKCWKWTVSYNVASRINILNKHSRLLSASQVPEVNCNATNSGTETWTESAVKVKKRRKRSQVEKYSLENVDRFVNSNENGENLKDIIELALNEQEKGTYLMDETVAKHLIDVLITHLKEDDSLVLEANPGLGIFTKELLKAGVDRLSLCETSLHFFNYLKNYNFPQEKVKIFHKDIIRFWKLQFLDKTDGGERMSCIFSGVSQRSWEDEPVLKLIAFIPNKKFVCNVMDNIISRTGFVKFGRPEFFVIIDPISYSALTNKGKQGYRTYRPNSVLFQIIFNYEILTRIPNSALVPPIKINKSLTPIEQKVLDKEGDSMYVVKMTPRKDLFLDEFDKYLPTFHYFLKQLFSARSNRIIPFLEHWVPGCGPRLIAKGLTIYTEVGEVEPNGIHNIFLEFIWRDKNSGNSFYASMDSYMLKKEDSDASSVHEDDS